MRGLPQHDHLPVFVVTHRPEGPLTKGPTTFTFTDGVERAVR